MRSCIMLICLVCQVSQSRYVSVQDVDVVHRQTRYDRAMMFIRCSFVKTEAIRGRMIPMIGLDFYIIHQLLIKFSAFLFSGEY
jgi:hypothetical protein